MAIFVWWDHLHGSHPIFFEDNQRAKASLLRGFSNAFAAALFQAVFCGSAAIQSRPWIARVASADNPADCLTKEGPDCSQLHDTIMVDPGSFDGFWCLMIRSLRDAEFPPWGELNATFAKLQ